MKRFFSGIIIGIMLVTTVTAIAAARTMQATTATFPIMVDGVELETDMLPVIIGGRAYLPVRALGEALGVGVEWNEKLSRVEIDTAVAAPSQGNEETVPTKPLALGDAFTMSGYDVQIGQKAEWTTVPEDGDEYAGKEVMKIPLTVTNNNDESGKLNSFFVKLFSPRGTQLDSVDIYFDDGILKSGEIRPGATGTTNVYILYDGDGEYCIEYDIYTQQIEVLFEIAKPPVG